MIPLSDAALSVLGGSYRYYCAVESWLDGQLLADNIPVSVAAEETDRGIRVPERVTFTVPALDGGVPWSPVGDDHPLAANGQRLHVKLGVGGGSGEVEWFSRGRFLIQDSAVDGDVVNVNAVGLLALIDEARLISPFQPSGTLASTLRGLLEPALTVLVDPALVDRSVPAAVNYDEDRLGAALELLDAWPAYGYVDPEGFLRVALAAQSTTPVLSLTDGQGGTVIHASGNSTRDGASNVIVSRGTASDGAQVQGVAYLSSGPKRASGPFNPLPVPEFFSSPLLTSIEECTAAAETIRDRKQRENAAAFRVEMVPHPALQAGDVVALTSERLALDAVPCTVEALTLPYTNPAPAMTLTARRLA
jgi:hypothetical protein